MTSPRREATYDRQRQRDGARPTQPGPVRVGHGDAGTRPSGAEGDPVEATDEEDRIGPYLIRDEVGRGSFATVFRGERCDTHALVAVKSVIRSKLTSKLLENLESEISILKRITHRNIVELKDCLKTDTHIYLIMAFCSAGDLSIYIRKRGELAALSASNQGLLPEHRYREQGRVLYPHPKEGGLNETIVRHFLGQLGDALKFLRAQNVIHRDIKPQNLLLQPAEAADLAAGHPLGIPVLKVADFGFARWLPSQSLAETLCGSPLYMAPEILRYEKYDAKADLWSVGAVLFEMCVGKPPFKAQNHVDLLRKIERGEDKIKFPDEKKLEEGNVKVVNRVKEDLKALIRGLLKRNPAERMGFDDFFAQSRDVAEGGSARGLTPAESISARYSAGLAATPPAPPLVSIAVASPVVESEAAFIATSSSSASRAHALSPSSPQPSTVPSPRPPTYTEVEPPAFARKSSVDGAGNRNSSYGPAVTQGGDVVARDFALARRGEGVRRLSSNGRGASPSSPAPDRSDSPRASDSIMEDDSVLGRDYVVVEKRTVEINALADELAYAPRRDNIVARRPSRGFLSRPLSSLGAIVPAVTAVISPSPYPPALSYDSPATPPFAIPNQRIMPSAHPYSLSSSPRPLSFLSSSPRSGSSPIERFPGSPLALVGSPSAAIAKALNMASLKLFGSPTEGILLRKSSGRKPLARSSSTLATQGSEEDKLLGDLEEIAQKALVIFDFADSKIIQILPPTPQTSSSTSLGTPSYFSHVAARAEQQQTSANPFSPVPTNPVSPLMRRTSSSSSDHRVGVAVPLVLANSAKADVLAAEALVLYLKALAFLGKGIELARRHWSERTTDQAASADFNEAVQWFRSRFNECFDKAEFAKSRALDDMPESATFAEKLIFDRALEMSRAAAVNELRGENPSDCEIAYETALWMLFALLDETMTGGTSIEEDDRGTLNKFIGSITTRLQALRKKIG